MRSRILTLAAVLISGGSALPASAQHWRAVEPYGPVYGRQVGGYTYADEFVRGTYVSAPLTRFPRPTQIVPTPWSYGTYGVPTVSGIAATPAGQPTLTVINGRARGAREDDGSGPARVIEVTVPRR